ncbi:hypothetical protein Zmor_001622 [Zophobas morio]|uniref:Tyr recombinase domain-containing protein n=1 Tax=Zophobas morio TaxID=2755281 RepID=A0AA38J2X1_9CUCU|nr:hypothetical protein Zmor_001622 [Zophobas morio]
MTSLKRRRGTVKQCSPGDDLEAAQGTVKQCSPGEDLEAVQGTVKQCSPGDDLEAAQGTVTQCSPGDDLEAAQGTDVRLKKSESAEVRAVVFEDPFNPQVSLKTANVEEQLHESLQQIDGSKELLWLLGPEPERSEESLLHSVKKLLMSEAYLNGPSKTVSGGESPWLVPVKSKAAYSQVYQDFQEWRRENSVNGVDKNILLAFFEDLFQKYSPNTLCPKLSMLKVGFLCDHGTSKHGYVPKKSEVLFRQQLKKFLREAPNDIFLICKVTLIMEIFGACRTNELLNMLDQIVINVSKTKNDVNRKFTIIDEEELSAARLVREYSPLRPQGVLKFFVAYRNKKCTLQPVGKNTFGKIPSKVAEWLGLDNPKVYTGHCGRRTSTTLVANAGATLKRHGGWRSSSVAEGYLADSMVQKNKVAKMIAGVEVEPSAASVTIPGVSMMASHVAQSSQSLVTVFGKPFKTSTELNFLSKKTTISSTTCEQDSSSFRGGWNKNGGSMSYAFNGTVLAQNQLPQTPFTIGLSTVRMCELATNVEKSPSSSMGVHLSYFVPSHAVYLYTLSRFVFNKFNMVNCKLCKLWHGSKQSVKDRLSFHKFRTIGATFFDRTIPPCLFYPPRLLGSSPAAVTESWSPYILETIGVVPGRRMGLFRNSIYIRNMM